MKQCPKCNRTYPTSTQRFCTTDGTLLVATEPPPTAPMVNDSGDLPTKVISRDLVPNATRFDPFKATVTFFPEHERTGEMRGRETGSLAPPPPQPPAQRETSAPLPPPFPAQRETSAPLPPPFPAQRETSAPLPPPPPFPAQRETSAPLPPPPFPAQRETSAPLPPPPFPAQRETSAPLPPPPVSQPDLEATAPSMRLEPSPPPPPPQASSSMPISAFGPAAAAAAPPPGPQTSGSLPPTGSGPIATPPASTSAPLPSPQFTGAAQAQQVQRLAVTSPREKSKLPLILGILAVLVVFGIAVLGVAYVFVARPMLEAKGIWPTPGESPRQNPVEAPSPNVEPTPAQQEATASPAENAPPPVEPPANSVQFVNSSDKLDGKLAEHYVDFSFYYPEKWEKDPKTGGPGASNFVEVHRSLPPDFTQESVAVSWYDSAGSFQDDQELFHSYVETKSSQFAQSIGEYRKVSEGPTKIGAYDAYEFRFEGVSQKTEKGQFKIWGRVIWLPPPQAGKNGITLLMLATSLAPELDSFSDVGEKGELPMILETFRFGRSASP